VSDLAKQTWPEHENETPTSSRLTASSAYNPGEIEDVGEMMQEAYRSHYKKFLRDKIPALDHMTPREAAKRPEMRARLVSLMKGHLQMMDGNSKKDGRHYDIGWVLDELGLGEMNLPARAVSTVSVGRWWREFVDEQEFSDRLQNVLSSPMAPFRLDDFPALAEYLDSIGAKLLNASEIYALILMVNYAIAVLIPEGIAVEDIGEVEMIRETTAIIDEIRPKDATDSEFAHPIDRLIEGSVQPGILRFAAGFYVTSTKKGKLLGFIPFCKKVRGDNIVSMLVHIEAFLRCLRRGRPALRDTPKCPPPTR